MNTNDATHSEWRRLCQMALLETDPVKLLVRIADARKAIFNRIEDFHSKSNDERAALRDALSMLDNLHGITERQNDNQSKAS
jgi:hypothetical protein